MPSHEHERLLDRITRLDNIPKINTEYSDWIRAEGHLELLRNNALEDEIIVYASTPYTFVHSVMVNEDSIRDTNKDDLMDWNGNPFFGHAGYVWGRDRNDVWIDRDPGIWSSNAIKNVQQLVFARDFEGLQGYDSISYEILQEYLQVSQIHWRSERKAYCRFDENGEFDHIVSITRKDDNNGEILISFKRDRLEQYLAVSNSVLVRMFDFMFFRQGEFTGWPDGPENTLSESDDFFFRQKVDPGKSAYTRGVQIVRPSRLKAEIFKSIKGRRTEVSKDSGVEFIALDWRNGRVASISTDPSATTNYFQASENSLPYEVSPAFFRPDVLHKYKSDRDKYTVSEEQGFISCRGSWYLRTYDANEAGQIHTYICYLRDLPHQEQLYWKSFNEEPKAGISERAFTADFKGEWPETVRPLDGVLSIARRWAESDVAWWKLGEESLRGSVNTPRTSSREEWSRAFTDLSKLIIEGFVVSDIRTRLEESGITFEGQEKSLKLIERFLVGHEALADGERLVGLREVQDVRSKVDSHRRGGAARDLPNDALRKFGSFSAHFESVCERVVQELTMIEKAFS